MINKFKKNIDIRMNKCLDMLNIKMNKIRTGRVSVKLLDGIFIEYYGSKISLQEVAKIIVETSNTLKISVFDHQIVNKIEKAIINSHLEINPIVIGNHIRIIIPPLTEERRKKLSKMIRFEAEKSRVCIRNIRREANDILKSNIKNKIMNKDLEYLSQNEIQKLTDFYVGKIDSLLLKKESEIMKF